MAGRRHTAAPPWARRGFAGLEVNRHPSAPKIVPKSTTARRRCGELSYGVSRARENADDCRQREGPVADSGEPREGTSEPEIGTKRSGNERATHPEAYPGVKTDGEVLAGGSTAAGGGAEKRQWRTWASRAKTMAEKQIGLRGRLRRG